MIWNVTKIWILCLPLFKIKRTKDGKWFYDWSDEELLKADRLGFYHKQSKVFTVDFDDKNCST